MWPGTPTTVALAGTLVTTTEPAPILAPSPIVTAPIILDPAPTTTPLPRVGWRLARLVLVPPRVDEQPLADLGAGVDLDADDGAAQVGEKASDQPQAVRV